MSRRFLPAAAAALGTLLFSGVVSAAEQMGFPMEFQQGSQTGPAAPADREMAQETDRETIQEITGRVLSAVSGEPLPGVEIRAGEAAVESAADGSFRIEVPAGARSLSFAAEGYFEASILLPAAAAEITVELAPRTFEEEVEVTARNPVADRAAATVVAPTEVLETAGSVDNIFRALTTLPGVAPTSDFGSFLSVRGGTPDQNLTLMDGVEIHNPYRLFGLVSAFNPETVSNFSLAAGGFGAKYGDRLSSLLMVRNRSGERDFGGTSSLSVTDANLVVEGPLPGAGSFLATGRRTYYDLVAGRILDQDFPSFADFQLRADWELGPGHRLTLTGIRSREDTEFSFDEEDEDERVEVLADAENDLGAARFDALISDRLTSTTIVAWYRNVEVVDFDALVRTGNRAVNVEEPDERDLLVPIVFDQTREVRDLSLRQELGIRFGETHFVETGFELHRLDSGLQQTIRGIRNESLADPTSVRGGTALPDALDSSLTGFRGGAWVQDGFRLSERFTIEPGLRLEWSTLNRRATLSPRFAASWDFGGGLQARAAGGVYTQSPGWEKLSASDTLLDLSDIRELEHERAYHAVLGIEKSLPGEARLQVEAYWKQFDGLLVGQLETEAVRLARVARYDFPEELAGSVPSAPQVTVAPVNGGDGSARGLDIYLERLDPEARLAGWVSYAYGKAERQTWGRRYPFEYDRPHALNLVGRVRLGSRLSLAGTARFASGFPYTPAVGIRAAAIEDARGRLVPERDGAGNLAWAADFGGLDNRGRARLPSYARLDLRLTYRHGGRGGRFEAYAEVINALNRENGVEIETEVVSDPAGGLPTVEQTPSFGFPRVPTVGIRFRF